MDVAVEGGEWTGIWLQEILAGWLLHLPVLNSLFQSMFYFRGGGGYKT